MVYVQPHPKSLIQKDIIQNLPERTGLHDHTFFQQYCSLFDAQIVPMGVWGQCGLEMCGDQWGD